MEESNKTDIGEIANKIGKLIIMSFLIEVFSEIFINKALVNLLHSYELLSKVDPIEIDMLIRSSLYTIHLIIISLFIFKPNIKDIFSNRNQVYKLSLKAKTKLTLMFISIGLFSAIVSSFIMMTYSKYIMDIPMPETTLLISIFAIFIAPVTEEILSRGIILNQLKDIGYSFCIIISSVYFGVMHGIGFLHAFIIGLILGFACILTGNIRWSIIIHLVYNFISFAIEGLFLPLLSSMNYNIGRLIVGGILFLIFLVTAVKDKEITELYEKVNIKSIIDKFYKDKEKYLIFINEPAIIVCIAGWIFMQLMPLFVRKI